LDGQDLPLRISEAELEERIAAVQDRIAAAARRAGRDPADVMLVAVSKTQPPEAVVAACRAGLRLFGENRAEEAGPKAKAVARLLPAGIAPVWHMVGHIQSRKARDVLPWARMVHSVDGAKIAERLSRYATEAGLELAVLLEVNVSEEASKYGLAPQEVPCAVEAISSLPGLRLEGLMTMAPMVADVESVRPIFGALRRLKDELTRRYPGPTWRHLSMGMSDDFEIAIEEGATLVRIGRAVFGDRQAHRM